MSNNNITLKSLAAHVDTEVAALRAEAAERHAEMMAALTGTLPTTKVTTTTVKASKKGKKAKKAKVEGPTFQDLRTLLVQHKAQGLIKAGVTVKQAIEAGLMTPDGKATGVQAATPPSAPLATVAQVAKPVKAGKTKADKTPEQRAEYTNYRNLRDVLKAHKASGAVPTQHNGTFVTVASAIADGLMNADGTVSGKAAKKAKASKVEAPKAKAKVQVTAKVTPAEPAKVRAADGPRNAQGHITHKREWELREALAMTGEYDRYQIDKKVRKAMKVLNG